MSSLGGRGINLGRGRSSLPLLSDTKRQCPQCGSSNVLRLYNRVCDRPYGCGEVDCLGCKDWISSNGQRSYSYRCNVCGHRWTILKRI